MKKLIVIMLALALVAGVGVGLSYAKNPSGPGYSGDIMGMATGRYASDPHRTFRLVRYANGSTTATQGNLSAGDIVIWDTSVTYPGGSDGVSVITTTISGDPRIAGQLVTAINSRDALATGAPASASVFSGAHAASEDVGLQNWGYVQTYGLSCVNATSLTTEAVGMTIGTSTTAGQITSTGRAGASGGFTNEAITAAATGRIFLKCE